MQLYPHLYADDTQICGFYAPAEASDLQQRISTCVNGGVSERMQANRLQLNAAKTGLLLCAPPRQQARLPNAALGVGSDTVQQVRYHRIYIDSDVSVRTHVSRTVSSCFPLFDSFKAFNQPVVLSLFPSLILTRLDYGSATLSGVPCHLLNQLQSVLNAAEHLVCHARKDEYDHVTHLLCDLHWLRFPERTRYISDWPFLSSVVVTTWRLCTSPVTCAGPTSQKRHNSQALQASRCNMLILQRSLATVASM